MFSGRICTRNQNNSNYYTSPVTSVNHAGISLQVGNSKGIRLSKTILDKYHITDKVELILENDYIILKPVRELRKNWDKAFAEMHRNGDDKLLIDSVFED